MKLDEFHLERIQSQWENIVDYNLSESGVEPLRLNELVPHNRLQREILETKLGYPQTNGSIPLRRNVSSLYEGATEDHVLVTNGGSEANMVSIWNMLHESDDRDEVVVELPNYMQIWGYSRAFGANVKSFWLTEGDGAWLPDIEGLKDMVSKKTNLIALCNPNNPTGATMKEEHLKAIAEIAEDCGAWILSDEIYRGAELVEQRTPTMWDYYDRVLVTSGLSKAYGLPGLRIGWIACKDEDKVRDLWSYSDYTSIAPSMLGDRLGQMALEPAMREFIEKRTKRILKENWAAMEKWLGENEDIMTCIPPEAAPVCLVKYSESIKSTELAESLIQEKSVLVAPGDHFLLPQTIRIGYGHDKKKLVKGLSLTADFLRGEE
ncbi:aminotransferase class I/II-fold pyridoxal phosphate-dependent enzyme [Candidatus Thorarchaeota archaeon]|nr:MAG: aminotransferase class I/II-fold pyridoxal phosphate-dependent enzyme [Candidatus Thorarchaeota archaeon]